MPWANKFSTGAGSVRIVVLLPGAHLLRQVTGASRWDGSSAVLKTASPHGGRLFSKKMIESRLRPLSQARERFGPYSFNFGFFFFNADPRPDKLGFFMK